MPKYDYDLIVIGGGAAGLTVTAGASQLGAKVLLVEQDHALGGDCLHYGCVPSKALIRSASVRRQMQQASKYGLPDVALPPVDFAAVARRIKDIQAVIQVHDSVERFTGMGADVRFGQAAFTDEHTVEVKGQGGVLCATGAKIVVATGSSAAIPPVSGLTEAGFLTNKEIFSLSGLPESLIVLGGGPIALEMAQAFQRLGTEVTVVQRSDQVLTREDEDMAAIVQQRLESEGVLILTGTSLQHVERSAGSVHVRLLHKGEEKLLKASELLVALGRKPNVEGLHLENAGVSYSARGVPVDARMRTNIPHIFAAGDVTGKFQFTHAAGYEGGIIIANAVFRLPRKADYTNMPWCTFTEPELASIGMNERVAKAAGLQYSVRTEAFSSNDRALAESEPEGRVKMLLNAREKVLGVQICGPHAGELINQWVAIKAGNISLSAVAGAVHPYPTLGEINKRVAGSLLSEKLFSTKVQSALCFLFGHQGKPCGKES
ncbi:dihydrolipoyl dehydrogenase family protein [Oleidesulfovibrio sp.]|uniref:dihydrolipoyl dehydrogenase family protein n=1 Tax=Oleidesulfovibrio sp. TaxID=2909707 RepID=UPI003A8547AE